MLATKPDLSPKRRAHGAVVADIDRPPCRGSASNTREDLGFHGQFGIMEEVWQFLRTADFARGTRGFVPPGLPEGRDNGPCARVRLWASNYWLCFGNYGVSGSQSFPETVYCSV